MWVRFCLLAEFLFQGRDSMSGDDVLRTVAKHIEMAGC